MWTCCSFHFYHLRNCGPKCPISEKKHLHVHMYKWSLTIRQVIVHSTKILLLQLE
jgi:hypothetical protein